MAAIDPEEYGSPVTEIDAVFRRYVDEISKVLGEVTWPVTPVQLRRQFLWAVVWFVDGDNNNLRVGLVGSSLIKVEITSSKDPTKVLFFVRSLEKLDELLRRFTPDHWKEAG